MAVLTPSSLISEIRGKVGSNFYSRNAHGPFVGEWTIPNNPNTTAQQVSRQGLADGMAAWQGLDDATRQVWYDWAASQRNAISISRKPSKVAFNEYCGRFVLRAAISGVSANPNPYAPAPSLSSITPGSVSTGSIEIDYTLPSSSVGSVLVICATPPVSSGIRLPSRSSFRQIAIETTSGTSGTIDIFTALTSKYTIDASNLGQVVHVMGYLVDPNDYTKSVVCYTKFTITSDMYTVPPYIAQKVTSDKGISSSATISFPSTPKNGSWLIVSFRFSVTPSITAPAGWTFNLSTSSTGQYIALFTRFCTSSESNSYTWSYTNSPYVTIIAYEIRNNSGVGSLSIHAASSTNGTGTTFAMSASSVSYPDYSLALAFLLTGNGTTSQSSNNSATEEDTIAPSTYSGSVHTCFTRSFTSAAGPLTFTATMAPGQTKCGFTIKVA